ncbi:MAG: hypothetical protein ACP5N1_00300 [Candidatus Woesearchaeota archaeon]
MKKKGQAAMEFLMTYGWAIVVVLAAIGALAYFGVLSPNKLLPDRTTFTTPLPNVDNAVVSNLTNDVTIAFKNNKGVAIKLPLTATVSSSQCALDTVPLVGTYSGAAITASTEIANGDGFLLTFNCTDTGNRKPGTKFKAEFTFQYENVETTQVVAHTGSVEGKYS